MNYSEFFTKFLGPLFDGFTKIFTGLGEGLFQMFNVVNYIQIVQDYKEQLNGTGIVILIISIILLLAIFGIIFFLIYRAIRVYAKYRRNRKKEDMLIEEIETLNDEVLKLRKQNEKFSEITDENGNIEYDDSGLVKNALHDGESRFYKLTNVDSKYKDFTPEPIENSFTLEEFCNQFRNYCANRLGLYYNIDLVRTFVAAFASNKLLILEGISGTGKTSLAYGFGKFVQRDIDVSSVQPSWRDSSVIFGFFNEFTKRFNETTILEQMYDAAFNDEIYITLLDEMNISRVEYYFAEMLSILEIPTTDQRYIEIVPNVWPNDPKKLVDGKIHIPDNMWYIGTINNDDSTFAVTDKVYDRAMPISLDKKCEPFEAPDTEPIKTSYAYFQKLLDATIEEHPMSQESLDKIAEIDKYIIDNFRISFGNRIVKQIKSFVSAYIACGGDEVTAIDYVIAHKVLRKFQQLNLAYFKDEIDGLITYLEKIFGVGKTPECKEFLLNLKKAS